MSTVQRHVGSGDAVQPPLGRFTYDTMSNQWDWDDEVYRIHGLEPGSVVPTTDYVLACKHPEDRERVQAILQQSTKDAQPFSAAYRLLAADGTERKVLLICDAGVCGDEGDVTSIEGYYIDLTEDFRHESAELAQQAVAESAQHRATIDRAVGGLMVAYGLDADQAFELLRWWSQNKNIKLRELAQGLVDAASQGQTSHDEIRRSLDCLLHDVSSHRATDEGTPAHD